MNPGIQHLQKSDLGIISYPFSVLPQADDNIPATKPQVHNKMPATKVESRDSATATQSDPGITNIHLPSRDVINAQSEVDIQSVINENTSKEGNPQSLPKDTINTQADVDVQSAINANISIEGSLQDVTQDANPKYLSTRLY